MVTARFPGVEDDQMPKGAGSEENWERITGFGVGITSLLIEDFLTHPFIVVRRQCMVNSSARLYHLSPISVSRIMLEMKRKQGLGTFWKGQGSRLAVRGINLFTELIISDLVINKTQGDIQKSFILKEFSGHAVGKIFSIVLTLPFYSASIAETVQTEQIDTHSGPLSFIKEGFLRLVGWQRSTKGHGRLLPLWSLVLPTLFHNLMHYMVQTCLQHVLLIILKKRGVFKRHEESERETSPRNMTETYFPELLASLTSSFLTDLLLYPLETVLYRLHLQGTRTMVDDTDNGYAVVSLCTNYEGLFDCFTRVRIEEGIQGFYRGFGSLLLQYILQMIVLRLTKTIYLTLSEDFCGATQTE